MLSLASTDVGESADLRCLDVSEPKVTKRLNERSLIRDARRRFVDVKPPVEPQRAARLANVLGDVRAHEREAEQGYVEHLVAEGNVRHVARDHLGVRGDMIEAVNLVSICEFFTDPSPAATEVTDHQVCASIGPADEVLLGI